MQWKRELSKLEPPPSLLPLIAPAAGPISSKNCRAMKWILDYSLVCIGAIVGVLDFVWALSGFDTAGVSTHGLFAIVLGTTFTVLVAVGLMALVFYSNRSGQDERAHHSDER